MKAHDSKVLLEPDETGGYVVVCPSLPGCYSQGHTIEAALDNIGEAMELCLEDMPVQGRWCRIHPESSSASSSSPDDVPMCRVPRRHAAGLLLRRLERDVEVATLRSSVGC